MRLVPAVPLAVAHFAQLMKDNLHSDNSDQAETRADGFPADELFATARTAVLVADATTGRLLAINPAAQFLLGLRSADLLGYHWHKAFNTTGADELKAAARLACALGTVERVCVSRPGAVGALTATLSTFFVSRVSHLLLHLDAVNETERECRALSGDLFDELDGLPLGFVVTMGRCVWSSGTGHFLTSPASHHAMRPRARTCCAGWI